MAKDAANAHAFSDGGVYVAPKGSTAPTSATAAPASPFEEVGWLGDAGITHAHSVQSTDAFAWQGSAKIRTIKSQYTETFSFQALERNAIVLGLYRPGSTPATVSGTTTTPIKAFVGQDIRAWVVDEIDGDVHVRTIYPMAEVTGYPSPVASANALTVYEFTVTAYPDSDGVIAIEVTDDPAAAVA